MNSQTGAIRIAAVFPNPGNVLRPGQFGRVKGETEVHKGALLIPQAAVQDFQGLQQVYVAGSDGKAHVVTVTLGAQVGTNWLVTGGVSSGALVITDNLQKLRDGAPVDPKRAPALSADKAANSTNNSAGR
jgi:membrane fusion protein (multidrug efflux system)